MPKGDVLNKKVDSYGSSREGGDAWFGGRHVISQAGEWL